MLLLERHFIIPPLEQVVNKAGISRNVLPGLWWPYWGKKGALMLERCLGMIAPCEADTELDRRHSVHQAHSSPSPHPWQPSHGSSLKTNVKAFKHPILHWPRQLASQENGCYRLTIDSRERAKNTYLIFDNTVSIIKRVALYVQRLCCAHLLFISNVLQASQRQYEYQMEKASWTLNYMSSCNFARMTFLQGNTEADVTILWKFYL